MTRTLLFPAALILLTAIIAPSALAQTPVNVALRRDEKTRERPRIKNGCSATHVFELNQSLEAEWASFIGDRALVIAPGDSKNFVIEFDSSDLEVGTYRGEISATCSDCAGERGCGPTKFVFPLQLTVVWSSTELEGLNADDYVAGQVLVALKAGPSKKVKRIVQEIEKKYQLKGLKVVELSSISRVIVLFALLTQEPVPRVVRRLQGEASIDSAQPNFKYTAFGTQSLNYEDQQYGPQKIKADLVQEYATGKGIRIAVVDTGIDEHRDLRGRVSDRRNFTDDKEYRQDVHGTILAGIIAAIPHNGFGINGIAPDAKIISIKVLKQKPGETAATGTAFAVIEGTDYAIRQRANVINMSYGTPARDPELSNLVKKAVRLGVVVVAAAGNSGPHGAPSYPAALNEVIAVSAIGPDNLFYPAGNSGNYIDLAAPGVDIFSTWPGNTFHPSGGTSEAAAHVTGVVALLLEKRPHTLPKNIKAVLEETSTDLGGRSKARFFGRGLVDACGSLEALLKVDGMCARH